MTYPPEIILRPVTIGGATTLESGEQLSLVAEIKSSRGLMWGATGWQFHAVTRTITGNDGEELSFSLPVTDLDGWRLLDNPGSAIDVSAPGSYTHTYTIKLTTRQGGRAVAVRTVGPFVLPAEDLSPVDLDLMLPVGTAAGGVALVPDSWGQKLADAVTAAQNAEAAVTPTFTATTETGAPGSQADVTLTSPEPGEWNLHFVTPTGAVGPSSDEDTLPNMVNLFPNPLFTDANADGTPDGWTKLWPSTWASTTHVLDQMKGVRYLRATGFQSSNRAGLARGLPIAAGDIHFLSMWVRTTVEHVVATFFLAGDSFSVAVPPTGQWELVSALSDNPTGATSTTANISINKAELFDTGEVVDIAMPVHVNLTAAFGSGAEPNFEQMTRMVRSVGTWVGRYGVAEVDRVARASLAPQVEQGRDVRAREGILRVAAWNVMGFPKNSYGVRAFAEVVDADLWALQESFDAIDPAELRTLSRAMTAPYMPYRLWNTKTPDAITGYDKGWEMYSNRPLRNPSWADTPLQGVQRAEIAHMGHTIAVYNIHLPSSSSIDNMIGHVNNLKAYVDLDPTPLKIIAGDWNTPDGAHATPVRDESALGAFVSDGWTHVQEVIGWVSTHAGTDDSYGYNDNIFVSPGLRILGGDVGPNQRQSDHRYIWADIALD